MSWSRLSRQSAPATEAVTLAEAKAHLRIDASDEDDLIERLIRVARDRMDGPDGIGVCLVSQEWRLSLDRFSGEIRIPMGPVLSIDEITYTDEAGDAQTLATSAYQWRQGRYEARILPAYGGTWPVARLAFDSVRVDFTAGFAGTADSPVDLTNIPETLRHAMLLLIGHLYENREAVNVGNIITTFPLGFDSLVEAHRVGRFG